MTPDLKTQEEEKRNKAWNPQERWRLLQETITWAESNLPYEKRRNRPRVPLSHHQNSASI